MSLRATDIAEQKRKRSACIAATQKQQLVQRNRVLDHPLAGLGIEREIGHQNFARASDVQARSYASSVEVRLCFRNRKFDPDSTWHGNWNVSFFDYDPMSRGLLLATENPQNGKLTSSSISWRLMFLLSLFLCSTLLERYRRTVSSWQSM